MGITDYLLYSRLAQYCESTMLQVKKLFKKKGYSLPAK